jgi:uncharacterized protein
MRVRIKDLAEDLQRQNLQEPARSLGLDQEKLNFTEPIKAQVTLQKAGDQIVCRVRWCTSIQLECSRCLEPTETTISGDMVLLVTFSKTSAQTSADPDVKVVPMGAKEVDISEEIRQTILLTIPGKPLCKADCLGLCPHCGRNLNLRRCRCQVKVEDTRWAGLQKLLPDKDKGEASGCS